MKADSWIDITKPIRRAPYTGEHDGVSFDEAVARITALVAVADGSGDSRHLVAHLRQLVPCLAMGRSVHSVSALRQEVDEELMNIQLGARPSGRWFSL